MSYGNIAKAKAIEKQNKEFLLSMNPALNDESGIYFLTRVDVDSIRYAYIGQAKHVLTRLAQHMTGYQQHIDLSIKKHRWYSERNPFGWKVGFLNVPESELDKEEQFFIKKYANAGYQLRNKTAGGQCEGKTQIDEYRPQKGYRDGIKQGKKSLARELSHIIDTHLIVELRPEKANNKVSQRAFEKFKGLLEEGADK